MSENLVGMYSARAVVLFGSKIWSTPDGKDVIVTAVCEQGKEGDYKWTDAVCVGPVVEYRRQYQKPFGEDMVKP